MMLYLVAEGVTQTGGLDLAMNFMLGKASTVFWAQVRGIGCRLIGVAPKTLSEGLTRRQG